MQLLHVVTLVICLTTALSFEQDIRQSEDAAANEVDNSVTSHESDNVNNENKANSYGLRTYAESGNYIGTDQVQNNEIVPPTAMPPPPENIQGMPITGCAGQPLPEENNVAENETPSPRSFTGPVSHRFNMENNYDTYNSAVEPQSQQSSQHHSHFPHHHKHHHHHHHHHHPHHYSHISQSNPWSPWNRNMYFVGPQQYNSPNQWSPWRRNMNFVGQQQFYSPNPWSPWRRNMNFVGQQQFYAQNPWSTWRRNMNFVGPQQFYAQNPWSPWRHQMPFSMSPSAAQFFQRNGANRPPLVIVKLLQPIILPVAKPINPDDNNRDFQRHRCGKHHRMGFRRFGGARAGSFENRLNGHSTYGPYKIDDGNFHISVKLH